MIIKNDSKLIEINKLGQAFIRQTEQFFIIGITLARNNC